MIQFQENIWTDGRADRLTLFPKNLPATDGGPKLFVKDIVSDKATAYRPTDCVFVFEDKC